MGTSNTSPAPDRDEISALKAAIAGRDAHIKILEEKLRLATYQQFAPSSEKLSGLGHRDLFNEAEALGTRPGADAQAAEIVVPAHTRERGKRKPIDPQLPRTRIEHDIPEAQKTCACGCQLSRIGEVTSEQIGMVPARGFVKQHVRFKYACRSCEGADHDGPAVITAPLPAQPLPKSNCSPELAAFITVSKYADGLPLYRLEGILARYKISVSRTAMACWMIKLGDLVQPLIDLFNDHMLAYDVLQMDETTVQVLKEEGRAAKDKSYMWVRRGGAPGQTSILFDYAATRAASVPMRLLADYQGFLQSDDYAGYNAAGKRDGMKHVGCLDHARRRFIKAVQAQHAIVGQERGLAPEALVIIRKLYAIEKLARDAKMSAEQRHTLRQEKAKPIWDELRAWLDKNLGAVPPRSLTGEAINYLAADWPRLIRNYAATRAASVPMRLLADYQGFLQSDDYAGYNAAGKRDGMKHVGCLDHARRRFIKAVQAQHAIVGQERGLAPEALVIIRKLYAIEKLARDAKMSAEQRHTLRQEKAKPIWDELRAWLDKNLGAVPPRSLTGEAINYLAADWPRLIRYLEDGRVEIANVLCENAIRPFVIGRKNWLFSDTPSGAHASARLYSIVETAKANGLEPYGYLSLIFERLPQATTPADIAALLPWNVQPATLQPTR